MRTDLHQFVERDGVAACNTEYNALCPAVNFSFIDEALTGRPNGHPRRGQQCLRCGRLDGHGNNGRSRYRNGGNTALMACRGKERDGTTAEEMFS